jgi:hypothetical protein
VGRSPYQSEKRRKELARLKKQEEKRQRRFNKKHEGEGTDPAADGTIVPGEPGVEGQPESSPQDNAQAGSLPEPAKEDQGGGQPS